MSSFLQKKVIVVFFDGVFHFSYEDYRVWTDCTTPLGQPTEGAIEWVNDHMYDRRFEIVIWSQRFKTAAGIEAVCLWFQRNGCRDTERLILTHEIPARYWMMVPRNAVGFRGTFPSVPEMRHFTQYKLWDKND